MALTQCAVVIAAHSDRSGGSAFNRGLSRRRAEAVRAYLQRRGITAELRIEAHGEDRPLADTPDGVHEPQNRRVEISVEPRVPR